MPSARRAPSTGSFGILGSARYWPRLRLERSEVFAQHRWMAPGLRGLAKGRRTMANWDEDAVTMAVEAARRVAGGDAAAIDEMSLVSMSLPFAERLNAAIVGAAVGLREDAVLRDVGSSARAGLGELSALLRRGTNGGPTGAAPARGSNAARALVVAAERRVARPASSAELIQGDGAAAVLVGHGEPIARHVASHAVQADFVDHFRESGRAHDYGWEERWVRDEGYLKLAVGAIRACLDAAGTTASDVAHFAMPAPLPRVHEAVARRAGFAAGAVAASLHEEAGDLGSAQPLALLDAMLRRAAPGARVLVAGFGSGCDVLLVERTAVPCPGAEPDAGRAETSYLKYLSFSGQLDLEWGMRAEIDPKTALTAAWREHARAARFEGGRCARCGTVQFPRSLVCVAPACRAERSQDPVGLADAPARVLSHTSDFLAYTPSPPFRFGHVDFEAGARVLMEFCDLDDDELAVGLPLSMVYRIKEFDRQRGFRRYFWKATADRAATPAPSVDP